jgi:hypothetical protein
MGQFQMTNKQLPKNKHPKDQLNFVLVLSPREYSKRKKLRNLLVNQGGRGLAKSI